MTQDTVRGRLAGNYETTLAAVEVGRTIKRLFSRLTIDEQEGTRLLFYVERYGVPEKEFGGLAAAVREYDRD